MSTKGWIKYHKPQEKAKFRLFCLPHAGGSASTYHEWQKLIGEEVEICPIQLPGRENKIREPLVPSCEEVVEHIIDEVSHYIDEKPYAIFGHSMGGLLAFQLGLELQKRKIKAPAYLFVSSSGPDFNEGAGYITSLSEKEFIEEVKRFEGLAEEALELEGFKDYYLPILRNDFQLVENYSPILTKKLESPIRVYHGLLDKTLTNSHLENWQDCTSNAVSYNTYNGGHFYIESYKSEVILDILETLKASQKIRKITPNTQSLESLKMSKNNKEGNVQFLQEAFQDVVMKHPNQLAVVEAESKLTYSELDIYSTQFAHYLQRNYVVKNEQPIALFMKNSIQRVIAILGILKAGGSYLTIDLNDPLSRNGDMLQASKVEIACVMESEEILARTFLTQVSLSDIQLHIFDGIDLAEEETLSISLQLKEDALLAVMFTSGTTGTPKGVMIKNIAVSEFCAYTATRFQINEHDRTVAFSNESFDASLMDLFLYLTAGSTIHIIEEATKKDIHELNRYFNKHKITAVFLTTSYFELFTQVKNVSLRLVFVGGERLLKIQSQPYRVVNIYGPTETTIAVTFYELKYDEEIVPIGKPVASVRIVLLDDSDNLVSVGDVGEICIHGNSLAAGYLNDVEQTVRAFVESPIYPGEVMYRTGDLGQLLSCGNYEFVSRIDNQVKHRGYRIELEEIKCQILSHGHISSAAVVYHDSGLYPYIAAFYCAEEVVNKKEVHQLLEQSIPHYMMPSRFEQINKIPLNENGKLDRSALMKLLEPVEQASEKSTVAKGQGIDDLWKFWSELLHVPKGSIELLDSFIDLGGHSILVIKLLEYVTEQYSVRITYSDFMKQPTLIHLLELISERPKLEKEIHYCVDEARCYEAFGLTELQQAYLMGRNTNMELGNLPTFMYTEFICKEYENERFVAALNKIIARHDVLNLKFSDEGKQQVLEEMPLYQPLVKDLRTLTKQEQSAYLIKERERMTSQKMDYTIGRLFDVRITRLTDSEAIIHLYHDGLILDGWSHENLIDELDALYAGETLHNLHTTFRDFVLYNEKSKTTHAYIKSKAFWLDRMECLPGAPYLPLLKQPKEIASLESLQIKRVIKVADWVKFEANCQRNGVSSFVGLLTAFGKSIARWSEKQSFLLSIPEVNRPGVHPDIDSLVGECSTFILFDFINKEKESFSEAARRNQKHLWNLKDHNTFSGIEVSREVNQRNGHFTSSLAPIVFTSLLDRESRERQHFDRTYLETHTSQIWIDAVIMRHKDEIHFNYDCVKDLFNETTLHNIFDTYLELIHELSVESELWFGSSQIALPEVDQAIISITNDTNAPVPTASINALLAESAAKHKNKVALINGEKEFTYEELFEYAKSLATNLKEQGVGRGDRVCILLPKGWEQIVSVIGAVYIGAAYMPLDHELPSERILETIIHAEVAIIVTTTELSEEKQLPSDFKVIAIDVFDFSTEVSAIDPVDMTPEDIVYVIHTSGSTGKPKGIEIAQAGLVNCLLHTNELLGISELDVAISLTSLSHDMAVYDVFGLLIAGGLIVMPEESKSKDPLHWARLIKENDITIWNSVPAFMLMLLETAEYSEITQLSSIRYVILGGDELKLSIPKRLKTLSPRAQLVNVGGPSETTLWNISHFVEDADVANGLIPYGKPFPNTKYHILNEHLELMPVGSTGVIYCEGIGLAKGYVNDPELTNEKFIIHPVTKKRLYNTGDLGRYLPDSNIEILGREDFQVKILGKRIELAEIENAIMDYVSGVNCIVMTSEDKEDLYAYYQADKRYSYNELRTHLSTCLASYMIPKHFIHAEEFPLNSSGKVNRQVLQRMPLQEDVMQQVALETDNEIVSQVADLYSEILGIANIGKHTNFFTAGGNSLKAIQLVYKLNNTFVSNLTISHLFELPTIAELAHYIENNKTSESEREVIPKYPETNRYPLSFVQESIWFMNENSTFNRYHIAGSLQINGHIDTALLLSAIHDVIEGNPLLKVAIHLDDKQPIHLTEVDQVIAIESVNDMENNVSIKKQIQLDMEDGFELVQGKLVRFKLMQIAEQKFALMIHIHHIIADAYSVIILVDKIIEQYQKALIGNAEEVDKQSEKVEFSDYIQWQKERYEAGAYEADLSFWKTQLSGELVELKIPGSTAIEWDDCEGESYPIEIPEALQVAFTKLCQANQITFFSGITSIYYVLLYKLTGEEDLLIGAPVSGRVHEQLDDLIGCFVHTLALRQSINAETSFTAFSQAVHKTIHQAFSHQGLSYEKIVSAMNLDRKYATLPYNMTIDYIDLDLPERHIHGVEFEPFQYVSNVAPANLNFFIQKSKENYMFNWIYRKNMFTPALIAKLNGLFIAILKDVCEGEKALIDLAETDEQLVESLEVADFDFI